MTLQITQNSYFKRIAPIVFDMNPSCYFCRREIAESQCQTCKRWVCIQCSDNHNCYPRD